MRQMIVLLLVLATGAMWPSVGLSQQTVDFRGLVFDAGSKSGIENLEVKLTPPRQTNLPIRLASTDRSGAFAFRQLVRGRYLLEISQGLYLLYRAEVDATKQDRVEIPLQRKR